MDIDSDPGLLVVDLEHCVQTDGRNIGKNTCIYTSAALPQTTCHEVLQLAAPVQCLGDMNQSLCRIQHLTHLQPVHYQQIQVNYDNPRANDDDMSPLYHSTTLHNFSPSQTYHTPFMPSLSPPAHIQTTQEEVASIPPPPPPPLPKLKKKSAPLDPNDVPRFPINEYKYYMEIEQLLLNKTYTSGVSENYKLHLRKRAQHYLIINNELYHNPKKPKKVVMRKEEQTRLLEFTHISSVNGIHLGIKKMLDSIQSHYFWRGLYEDVANYVNSCPQCRDSVDLAQFKEREEKNQDDKVVDDPVSVTSNIGIQTTSTAWSSVEVQLHGPFKLTTGRNEFIITITDPESCFVQAAPLPRSGCSTKLTEYILKTFYTFGFPKTHLVCAEDMFEVVSTEFDWRVKQTAWKTKLIRRENAECTWVSQLIELLIIRKSEKWDKEMDRFMFQFRAGFIRGAFFTPTDSAPFYSMFQRAPYHEDKENLDFRKRNLEKMRKNPIQCEQCDDIFTSKVTYRQHHRRHLVEEVRTKKFQKPSDENENGSKDPVTNEATVDLALDELKSYLEKTKDSRRKRGKYQKYSVDLQEHMISYALKHGSKKASSYFTQLIGSNVSDSTIRNLIRSSYHFQPRTKEDIARYAVEFGVEKASKHFTELLNKDVSVSLARKFKAIYGSKFKRKELPIKSLTVKYDNVILAKTINSLNEKEKDDIGLYACEHSVQETIKYFREKSNLSLSETEVVECRKEYLDKQALTDFEDIQATANELPSITYQTIPLTEGNMCFSPTGSIVQLDDCSYSYNSYRSNVQQDATIQETSNSNLEVNDNFLLVSQENQATSYQLNLPIQEEIVPKSVIGWNKQQNNSQENYVFQVEVPTSNQEDITTAVDQPQSSEQTSPTPSSSKGKKKTKKKESGKKRGSYTTYSPELRAKIGKYAAENGSHKASSYFSKILGHDLPESTARGLKEKYLSKVRHCDVTSLGYSPRGRPLRLGKYDEVVQECLKELVKSGERVTSFLAITTAKQILSKLEPNLLKENGGTIVLNSTWAKSFLKRIGVRNNS